MVLGYFCAAAALDGNNDTAVHPAAGSNANGSEPEKAPRDANAP